MVQKDVAQCKQEYDKAVEALSAFITLGYAQNPDAAVIGRVLMHNSLEKEQQLARAMRHEFTNGWKVIQMFGKAINERKE